MKRLSIVLSVLATIAFIAVLLIDYWESYRMQIGDWRDNNVELFYSDNQIGKVYKINTLKFPDESIVEYYWNGNRLLESTLRISPDSIEDFYSRLAKNEQLEHFKRDFIREGADSLTVLSFYDKELECNRISIYDLEEKRVLQFFGHNLDSKESENLGLLLLDGYIGNK